MRGAPHMKVTVKLQGMVDRVKGAQSGCPIELSLPEDATAGQVLRALGELYGEPFPVPGSAVPGSAIPGSEKADSLHGSLRVFVNGELSVRPDRTPLSGDAASANVTIVIMSAVAGGA